MYNIIVRSNYYLSLMCIPGDDDIPGIGQYDDFHTIDWQRDIARDRMRHRYIVKKRQDSIWDLIKVNLCLCDNLTCKRSWALVS